MRVKVVNQTAYPDAEVKTLVRTYGLCLYDGENICVIVRPTKKRKRRNVHANYSGVAYRDNDHVPPEFAALAGNFKWVVVVRVGPADRFPSPPYQRHQIHNYQTWQEVVVGITAHEARHVLDFIDGVRYPRRSHQQEANAEAHEREALLRYREATGTTIPDPVVASPPLRRVVSRDLDAHVEELECGHRHYPRNGKWHGLEWKPTPAKRRRCRACLPEGVIAR